MDSALRINLFGHATLIHQGMAVDFRAPARAMALLGFLLLHRERALTRDEVAFTFWPALPEVEARAKLRYYLYYLTRDGLPPAPKDSPWIIADKRHLRWNAKTDTALDVDEFLSLAAEPDGLERAVELYQGELLEGHDEDWLRPLRDRLRQQQVVILTTLIGRSRERGNLSETMRYAQRLLELDPWHEEALRALVRAKYDSGDRSGAIRAYNEFAAGLNDELGLEPQAATLELQRQIANGEKRVLDAGLWLGSNAASAGDPPTHNLPAYLTAFVGRQDEIGDVGRLLSERRLVTLTGIGGIGKSRLAVEVARSVLHLFPDGIYFIDLSVVSHSEMVVQKIASTLNLPERPGDPIVETVIRALRSSHTLLLIDNCEHLLPGVASAVERLLLECASVRALATSRAPLRIQGECVKQLGSLSLARIDGEATTTLAELSEAPATHLFLLRAADLSPSPNPLRLDPDGREALVTICRRLDGIPLAIELAAALTNSLDLPEIARTLDHRFEVLTIGNRGAAARQQTLRATLDWSYELLNNLEKRVFERLGVFSGGWSLEAVAAVCADILTGEREARLVLASLREKSLIYSVQRGSVLGYSMLETMRSYALDRLNARGATEATRQRQIQWCIAACESANGPWIRPNAPRCALLLKPELENIRLALEWSLAERNAPELGIRLVHAARTVLAIVSLAEMIRWAELALQMTDIDSDQLIKADLIWDLAAARDSSFGRLKKWRRGWKRALAIYRTVSEKSREAHALSRLSEIEHLTQRYDRATTLADQGLALARSVGEPMGIGWALLCKAFALPAADVEQRRILMAEAIMFLTASGQDHVRARAHYLLAEIEFESGNFEAALAEARTALEFFSSAGLTHFALFPLANIPMYLNAAGRHLEALQLACRVIPAQLKYGTKIAATTSLQHLAFGLAKLRNTEDAARIIGYCDHQFRLNKMEQWPADLVEVERLMEILRNEFEPNVLGTLMNEGAALDEATVVDLALRKANEVIQANEATAPGEGEVLSSDQPFELVEIGV